MKGLITALIILYIIFNYADFNYDETRECEIWPNYDPDCHNHNYRLREKQE
jgi:hypothetical protein